MTTFAPGLYVVATPIGNLQDLSPRAAALLRAAAVVAAEDTRTSARIARLAGSHARRVSLTEHNLAARAPALIEAARESVVTLVSDAGTPVISDPGARLVEAAHSAGVSVFSIPGPSAVAAAVSVSGFEAADFHFLGFLPRARGQRIARLQQAAQGAGTLVVFESPRRLGALLRELAAHLGDPEVAVCRELTKIHEEVVRGRASALVSRFEQALGECTIVIRTTQAQPSGSDGLEEYMQQMQRAGARRASAAAEAARRFGVTRAEAYRHWR